ncbi:ABC transporter ATP-binding protein [Candidatus Saganbacteria bacterium]|nr:ABC transporter ATP-binding protein [Candidatus Saganbacteria bacterium]
MAEKLIDIIDLHKNFAGRKVIDGLSLSINFGDSLGLVGESGSGKTTLARMILKLINYDAGSIIYNVSNIRRDCGIVFQDPQTSLNPKIKLGDAIAEPSKIHGLPPRVGELLKMVNLPESYADRWPHELSGGERQRVGIARAISTNPKFLILDEPVSSLDLSISLQILDLLKELKEKLGMTYIFIAHDLAVIKYIATCICVMQGGRIIETGDAGQILNGPKNEYTQKLIKSSIL